MPPRTTPTRVSALAANSVPSAAPPDAVYLAETLVEEAPHIGRESEYEAVVSYVARRWSHEANTALFVCGGCGCGKTSTVKRALRAMSGRVLPCDSTGRSLTKRSSLEERGWRSTMSADVSKSANHTSNTLLLETNTKLQLSCGISTPRTSQHLSSDGAGLTPSSSLSCALSHTPSAFTSPDAAVTAAVDMEATLGTPIAVRNGSLALTETALFTSSSTSSPTSGRPSASSSEDSTASALAAAGPACNTHKRSREEFEVEEGDSEETTTVHTDRRRRRYGDNEDETRIGATHMHTRSNSRRSAAASLAVPPKPFSLEYFQSRYPEVFVEANNSSSSRSLFGHYVNCADVSSSLLVEAICESIQATCTRSDGATHTLLQQLSRVNGKTGNRSNSNSNAVAVHRCLAAKQQQHLKTALHVVALDEVEYVRGGGAKTLAQLAELAFQLPGQLAFIFISNQRAFVHVPQMMLEALLFEPYSEEQLRRIGADATSAELHRCELMSRSKSTTSSRGQGRRTVATATTGASIRGKARKAAPATPDVCASDVDIKPRLYDYIARKALLEYSGDVRQVIAMCHRVVSVAWKEVAEAKAKAVLAENAPMSEKKTVSSGRCTVSVTAAKQSALSTTASTLNTFDVPLCRDLPSKLEAAVETYKSGTSCTRGNGSCSSNSSTSSAGGTSASSSARTSTAFSGTATAASTATTITGDSNPQSSSGVMTLAKSVRLLQSNQVESDIDRYVGTLPEQTLYVLSCIVVLTLRKQEECVHSMTSVGGRMGTSRTPGAGVTAAQRTPPTLSLRLREVHQLYTRLMAELHFPAMRADGFPLQVECLADFGVLTRPQLRGTDRIFSLNGTWTLQAMQQALVKRGEAIKADRTVTGAEAVMENKFEEVLRELARLVKY